jgi:hypothetical protein
LDVVLCLIFQDAILLASFRFFFSVSVCNIPYSALSIDCLSCYFFSVSDFNIPYSTLSIYEVYVSDVTLEQQVYVDGDRPSTDEILGELRIGAFDTSLTQSNRVTEPYNDIKHYKIYIQLTVNSIFEVLDTYGVQHLRKNLQ